MSEYRESISYTTIHHLPKITIVKQTTIITIAINIGLQSLVHNLLIDLKNLFIVVMVGIEPTSTIITFAVRIFYKTLNAAQLRLESLIINQYFIISI